MTIAKKAKATTNEVNTIQSYCTQRVYLRFIIQFVSTFAQNQIENAWMGLRFLFRIRFVFFVIPSVVICRSNFVCEVSKMVAMANIICSEKKTTAALATLFPFCFRSSLLCFVSHSQHFRFALGRNATKIINSMRKYHPVNSILLFLIWNCVRLSVWCLLNDECVAEWCEREREWKKRIHFKWKYIWFLFLLFDQRTSWNTCVSFRLRYFGHCRILCSVVDARFIRNRQKKKTKKTVFTDSFLVSLTQIGRKKSYFFQAKWEKRR